MSDKCIDKVQSAKDSRIEDLQRLWNVHQGQSEECTECEGTGVIGCTVATCEHECDEDGMKECPECEGSGQIEPDEEGYLEDIGNLNEYGLAFDYVAPGTFTDQKEPYFRYQISYGGPSEEFRIYASKIDDYNFSVYRIEFWYLHWFDGAPANLHGSDYNLIEEIFTNFFVECGTANHILMESME